MIVLLFWLVYVREIDSVPIYSVRTKVFLKPRELGDEEASAGHTGPYLVTTLRV